MLWIGENVIREIYCDASDVAGAFRINRSNFINENKSRKVWLKKGALVGGEVGTHRTERSYFV